MYKKNNNLPGERAALYARVSTEKQAGEDRFSIPAQLSEMREAASARNWEIVGEFVDEGISGRKMERPQLQALLEFAKNKGCDIIVVHELSRLSRSVYNTLDIFEKLGKAQIGFLSVKDPGFDFADPSKRFFLTIMAAIHEYYVDLLILHTSKAKRERSKQGLYNASIMPLGYDHSGESRKPATINKKEAVIIRLIFESYAAGRFSDQDIADLLNRKDRKTRTGRRFSKDAISQILTNPFYVGKIVYKSKSHKREVFAGLHEALITDEIWGKCQQVRSSRRSLSRAVQKKYRTYLLSNIATCDVCGRTLRAQGTASGSYYREMSYQRGFADCPHQKTGVRADLLEKQIHTLINYLQLPTEWISQMAERVGSDSEMISLRRQRDRLEAARRRIQQMRIEGEFDENMDSYHIEMDRIRRESSALPSYDQIEILKITAKTIKQLYEIWETAKPEDQRDLLRLMLREVKIDVPNGRITSITPLSVFVPIFRELPTLHEHEFGEFVPLWDSPSAPFTKILDAATENLNSSITLPFFDINPLLPPEGVRNASGIASSLRAIMPQKEARVVQVIEEGRTAFPMDLRKWAGAQSQTMSLKQYLNQTSESFDIVISQFILWENTSDNKLQQIHSKIKPGGIWYFNELLPTDFPSHWLFRALPLAWEWAKKNTWSLHTLYNRLQEVSTDIKLKRHVFVQPVSVNTAENIINKGPLIIRAAPEMNISIAIGQLRDSENQKTTLNSELTVIEGWVKKKVSPNK